MPIVCTRLHNCVPLSHSDRKGHVEFIENFLKLSGSFSILQIRPLFKEMATNIPHHLELFSSPFTKVKALRTKYRREGGGLSLVNDLKEEFLSEPCLTLLTRVNPQNAPSTPRQINVGHNCWWLVRPSRGDGPRSMKVAAIPVGTNITRCTSKLYFVACHSTGVSRNPKAPPPPDKDRWFSPVHVKWDIHF